MTIPPDPGNGYESRGRDNPDWYQRDLVPRPDPTLLTNAAIEQVTVQYRRELDQLREVIDVRLKSMDQARQQYLVLLDEKNQLLDTRVHDLQALIEARLEGNDRAVVETKDVAARVRGEIEEQIGHLREIVTSRDDAAVELLEVKITNLNTLLDERYATQTKALDAAFVAAEKAVATALASAEKAVSVAERANEKRFEGVNEFRSALTDQAATFLPRAVFEASLVAVEDKITDARDRLTLIEGLTRGINQAGDTGRAREGLSQASIGNRLVLLGVGISVVVIIVNVVIAIVIHK
jgi:hypothetical protein